MCVCFCLFVFGFLGGFKVSKSIHPQSESLRWLNWVWCDFWEQKGIGVTLSLLELPLLVRVAAKKHFLEELCKQWRSHDSQTPTWFISSISLLIISVSLYILRISVMWHLEIMLQTIAPGLLFFLFSFWTSACSCRIRPTLKREDENLKDVYFMLLDYLIFHLLCA